jgi:hypothetical protein
MNRIEKKETAPETAKLFEGEVLELKPDIPRKELCDMVDDYIYYQTDDMSKEEAHAIVDITCRRADVKARGVNADIKATERRLGNERRKG